MKMHIHHINITSAYIYADLDEPIYIEPLPDLPD